MKTVGRVRSARMLAVAVAAALATTGLIPGAATAQIEGPEDCPEAVPTSEMTRGMDATGYTVSEGTEPEPFDVEVLGVLEDGVAPGRDMIVVDTSSPAIDEAGGIWFGMSGSPVYDDATGRLIGAVAFGLTFGPSSIGGLTPAEDLFDLLDYPAGVETNAAETVELEGRLAERVDARTGNDASDTSLERLRAPLSVSGMTQRSIDLLAKTIRKEGGRYVVTQGSSSEAAAPGAEVAELGAGDTFAGALSYGDITLGGIGTAALVCDDKSVAFGHPFSFSGRTELGANVGDTLTIVDGLFGPYKLATIGDFVGTVDQDRLAGIRALLGLVPQTRPVTSLITAPDIDRTQDGTSLAVTDDIVPVLGFFHLFSSIDSTFDAIGEGNSRVAWTVTGTTEEGEPWALTRSNLYSSRYDIALDSSFEVFGQLIALLNNKFTEIDFDEVDLEATVVEERRDYRITKLLHSKRDGGYESGRRVTVRPGGKLFLRAKLAAAGGGAGRTVDLQFKIPRNFRRGSIELGGGGGGGGFFCFEGCRGGHGKAGSFDELIDNLEDAPKGNDLTATFSRGRNHARTKAVRLDRVVTGFRFLVVRSGKGGGGGSAGPHTSVSSPGG